MPSAEQANGIDQVNKALDQMDEVTQQNSALVEENAAAAKTLEQQAAAMNERVAFFKLDDAVRHGAAPNAGGQGHSSAAPAPAQRAAPELRRLRAHRPTVASVGRMQSALATALKDDPDWKEFWR